jgi:hypothetical protein
VTLDSALTDSAPTGTLTTTGPTRVDGRSVVEVSGGLGVNAPTGTSGSQVLYVSDVSPYLPVMVLQHTTANGQRLTITVRFSNWGENVSVVAPSNAIPASSIGTSTFGT